MTNQLIVLSISRSEFGVEHCKKGVDFGSDKLQPIFHLFYFPILGKQTFVNSFGL